MIAPLRAPTPPVAVEPSRHDACAMCATTAMRGDGDDSAAAPSANRMRPERPTGGRLDTGERSVQIIRMMLDAGGGGRGDTHTEACSCGWPADGRPRLDLGTWQCLDTQLPSGGLRRAPSVKETGAGVFAARPAQ